MANLFEVLEKDHLEVKTMLSQLESSEMPGGARRQLAEKLVIEESKHEALEETYFWPTVREKLPDGEALAAEGIGQESEGKEVLTKLDRTSEDQEEFDQLIHKFTMAAREHIAFEESQVWPRLRSALSTGDSEELGHKFAEGKSTAPTRPHPHTPPNPSVLKTAGKAVGAADRAMDKISNRGS